MTRIIPLLAGYGVRIELEGVRHPSVAVNLGGVSFEVTEQVAQAIEAERRAHTRALDARAAPNPELAEARRAERTAREQVEALRVRLAAVEAELAEERGRREAYLREAVAAGVQAAGTGGLWRGKPVLSEAERAAWWGPGGHA